MTGGFLHVQGKTLWFLLVVAFFDFKQFEAIDFNNKKAPFTLW